MGTDYSGSGSTANTADIGGNISVTDNAQGDLLSFLTQSNSPGATATLAAEKVNWVLIGIGALALALAAYFLYRKNK